MARPTSREERISRARRLERSAKIKRAVRWSGIAVAALVVIAGAAYGISMIPEKPGMVHWHATYRVFVHDEEASFANPAFDGMKYGAAHLHAPAYNKIHNEGREGAGTLGSFFEFTLGGELSDSRLVLPPGTSHPGTYEEAGENALRLFVDNEKEGRNWTELESGFGDISFQNGDRYLILYGNYAGERIEEILAEYPSFDPDDTSQG